MEDGLKVITAVLGGSRIKHDEPLKYHTLNHLEEKAYNFYIATTQKELVEVLNLTLELKTPIQTIGAGIEFSPKENSPECLVVKNRTHAIKLSGIKGKIGQNGLGIESALLEIDSGNSIHKINEYLREQNLSLVSKIQNDEATIGDELKINQQLQNMVETVKIWDNGVIDQTNILDLQKEDLVLSVILRVQAKIQNESV